MAILKTAAKPEELINFLAASGLQRIDIDAMKISHCPSHTFEENSKTFFIILLYADPHRGHIEKVLIDNKREFKWQ